MCKIIMFSILFMTYDSIIFKIISKIHVNNYVSFLTTVMVPF